MEIELISQAGLLTVLFLFLSGFIKGAIGFGQPLVAISLLTLVHSVETSVALISIPLIATNLKLAFGNSNITTTFKKFRFLILSIVLGTAIGVAALAYVNKQVVQLLLGSIVILFVMLGFFKVNLTFSEYESKRSFLIGLIVGVIGGITSAFGPLLAIYLKSLKLN